MATTQKRAPRSLVEKPSVLIFKEKHGSRYFSVTNDKELFAVALKVLTERFKDGYWYYAPGFTHTKPDFTEEQIKAMPLSLREEAWKKFNAYKTAVRQYELERSDYDAIVKAVNTKDGKAAWDCLRNHNDGQYEGYEIEGFESLED